MAPATRRARNEARPNTGRASRRAHPCTTVLPVAFLSHAAVRPARSCRRLARGLDGLPAGSARTGTLCRGVSRPARCGQVARRERRKVAGVSLDAPEPNQALVALAEVRASIDQLDRIAGRLARTATAHGAPWEDVGSSLGISADQARHAYAASCSRERTAVNVVRATDFVRASRSRCGGGPSHAGRSPIVVSGEVSGADAGAGGRVPRGSTPRRPAMRHRRSTEVTPPTSAGRGARTACQPNACPAFGDLRAWLVLVLK